MNRIHYAHTFGNRRMGPACNVIAIDFQLPPPANTSAVLGGSGRSDVSTSGVLMGRQTFDGNITGKQMGKLYSCLFCSKF